MAPTSPNGHSRCKYIDRCHCLKAFLDARMFDKLEKCYFPLAIMQATSRYPYAYVASKSDVRKLLFVSVRQRTCSSVFSYRKRKLISTLTLYIYNETVSIL